MKFLKSKGFTLVELLIVIALIGILSVAVLSTINPIEQSNKANDAKNKNDAAEILSAIERYYASQQMYPWNAVPVADTSPSIAFGGNVNLVGVGICGPTSEVDPLVAGDCTAGNGGVLVATDELKSAFMGKSFLIADAAVDKKMYVYKAIDTGVNADTASSVYVCFVPTAKATRTDQTKLKTFTALTDITAVGMAPATAETDCSWSSETTTQLCYMCVPE